MAVESVVIESVEEMVGVKLIGVELIVELVTSNVLEGSVEMSVVEVGTSVGNSVELESLVEMVEISVLGSVELIISVNRKVKQIIYYYSLS
jgi:hypothetical protein